MSIQEPHIVTGLDRLQATWGPYLDGVFPQSTHGSITEHLAREVAELIFIQGIIPAEDSASLALAKWAVAKYGEAETIGTATLDRPTIQGEIGDVLALTLHLSHRWGVSFHQALWATLEKVRARTEAGGWGEPDGAGVVEHTTKVQGPEGRQVSPDAIPHLARIDALKAIRAERDRQIALGWTPDHDDSHILADWIELIAERADSAYSEGEVKRKLIQIGALALAAVESLERKALREEGNGGGGS